MPPTSDQTEKVRDLVLEYGWNTTCYQLVNPGFTYWFSAQRDAVIGYTRHHSVRIVAGAPVCSLQRLPEVLDEFHKDSRTDGVCYFAAEQRVHEALAHKPGFSVESLGAQPMWEPESWVKKFAGDASLRAQLNRARNKDVTVSRLLDPGPALKDLRRCLDEWLSTRRLPPMHFLIEPETLGNLEDRAVYIARRGDEPVGFVALSPISQRKGWLSEQFIRAKKAPNGTVELMLDYAVHDAQRAGAELFTMGIVPLSELGGEPINHETPGWLRWIEDSTRKLGSPFYDFKGLEHFKNKFHPDYWEPIYAISREDSFSPRTLLAIGAAFSGGHSGWLIGKGIARKIWRSLH